MEAQSAVGRSEGIERRCNLLDLGRTDYGSCLKIQRELLGLRQNSMICDTLVLTEHDPVITFGRGFREEPPSLPVPVYQIERGGEGTYHGPGQMVAYPILNLTENKIGVRRLVSGILDSAVYALGRQGISSEMRFDPVGVWVGKKKIASLGLAVKRWVSFHGVAINVNNSLDGFAYINPCGMSSSTITSARRLLGRPIEIEDVKRDFIHAFMDSFGFHPEKMDKSSLSVLRRGEG